jgi:polyferredoxin
VTEITDMPPGHGTISLRPANRRQMRKYVQYAFLLFNIYIGINFYLFYLYFESGGQTPFVNRPPSVEAYLPIAALMSLKLLANTGIFDPVHPAGLVILMTAILSAAALRRGFCSWICPIGTVSEAVHKLGGRIGCNVKPPRFVDIPLRSLKYLILGFFVYAIAGMSAAALGAFMSAPFNTVADIKLLMFFKNPSATTITVLLSFVLLSLAIKNFWCRYLCPYGAMLGLVSKVGLFKIKRDVKSCTDCKTCEQACPSYISISRQKRVGSAECIQCFECVKACPEKALSLKTREPGFTLKPMTYGLLLVGLFLVTAGLAQLTGRWETTISLAEYARLIPQAARFGHP